MIKKKLLTNKDGTLSYPHNFKLGDLVEINDIYLFKQDSLDKFGIVTDISNDTLVVFWQNSQKQIVYNIASAVLILETVQ